MVHDYLIDTILERAFDAFDNNNYIDSAKYFSRAWKRVYNNIKEEGIKAIEEYEQKYENDMEIECWIAEYICILQDCFFEKGDKKYLEETISFKEEYGYIFKTNKYLYCHILKYSIEAIYYLGRKDEAIKKCRAFLKEYKDFDGAYISLSRFLGETGKVEEGKKVLSDRIKESKESDIFLKDILQSYEEEYS